MICDERRSQTLISVVAQCKSQALLVTKDMDVLQLMLHSVLCFALGGNHNKEPTKDPLSLKVEYLFVFVPPRNHIQYRFCDHSRQVTGNYPKRVQSKQLIIVPDRVLCKSSSNQKYRTHFVHVNTRSVHQLTRLMFRNREVHYRPPPVQIAGSFRVLWIQFALIWWEGNLVSTALSGY